MESLETDITINTLLQHRFHILSRNRRLVPVNFTPTVCQKEQRASLLHLIRPLRCLWAGSETQNEELLFAVAALGSLNDTNSLIDCLMYVMYAE
jgi:hypothetical protein